MRNSILLCLVCFVASAGLAERKLTTNEAIWPELLSLLGDGSIYKECKVKLDVEPIVADSELWRLRVVDDAGNEAYHSFDGHKGGHFDNIRIHSYVTGYKRFYDTQELRISEGRVELEVTRYYKWLKPKRGGGGIFGSSSRTVGFIERILRIVVEDGAVQTLELHDYYHRRVLGHYPLVWIKKPVNCKGD